MKKNILKALVLSLITAAAANAALMVDFEKTGATTAAGYKSINIGDNVVFGASDTYTDTGYGSSVGVAVGIDDGVNDEIRALTGAGGGDLLNDYFGVDGRGSGNATLTVTLSGLDAGSYDWTSFHWGGGSSLQDSTITYTLDHAGTQLSGSFYQVVDDSVNLSFTSDGSADVVFSMTAAVDQFGELNGIEVVPEPASIALVGLASIVLLASRRLRVYRQQ